MAYILKSHIYKLILMSLLLLIGCDDNNITDNESSFDATSIVTSDQRLLYLLPQELDSVYAVQHAGLKLPNTTNYSNGKSDSRFFNSAVFSDGKKAIQMENVTCENTPISFVTDGLPLKYFDYWMLNTGPTASDTINWTFDYGGVTVNTYCSLPNDFDEISISSGNLPLDMSDGGSLNWGNTDNDIVVLTFTYYTYDSTSQDVIDSRILMTDSTVNNGDYFLSDSLFVSWGISESATHLNVHLMKGNHKLITFDNNKKVLTLSTVETNYMLSLK